MNEKDHERIEELFAVQALGKLEASDAEELVRSVAAHGERCSECRRLQIEYEEVAGRLGFSLPPEKVPEGMAEDIVGERRPRERVVVVRERLRLRRLVAAAVAAALLVGVGGLGGYVLAPDPAPGLAEAAAYVSQVGTRITPLEGSGQGNLALAFQPGRQDSYLIGSGLPPAAEGQVYELWLMQGGRLRPAATFGAERDVVVVLVPADPSTAARAAVTVERAPGAERPTKSPIFAATITPPQPTGPVSTA